MKKVITYGTFDLFHEGHYNLLKRAKALGDYLIVGVTTEHFDEARGKVNVLDPIVDRIANVRETGLADEIIVEDHQGQKIEDIQRYNVDIFAIGSDWNGTFDYLNQFCQVVYLERTPGVSSTALRNKRFQLVDMGIVGTGRIVPRFFREVRYVSGVNVKVAYNPVEKNPKRFEKQNKVPIWQGDFSEFLDGVNAIYIASPHETHYAYTKQALEAGVHVLCEKPLTFTQAEAEELYAIAKANGAVLLEAVKTAYCPGFQQLLNVAQSGEIGEIRDVEACFSRIADENSREFSDTEYGGGFLEYGGYPLLPIIKLLGLDYREIRIDNIIDEKKGIDMYSKITLIYENGFAMAKTGVGVKSEGQLVVAGTKGYILVESPWWLTRKFVVRYEDPNQIKNYSTSFMGDGLRYEVAEFVRKINGMELNGYKLTAEESIAMAGITEQFMKLRKKQKGEAHVGRTYVSTGRAVAGESDETKLD